MFDRLASDGDRTSTGGEVIGRSGMYDERGKMYARKGNKATCGTCKGAWEIYGTANDWMDDGYPMVKDGDRVICPCGENVVLAGGGSNAFYSKSKDEVAAAPSTKNPNYDQKYTLKNGDGKPLANVHYRASIGGSVVASGVTDSNGCTERIRTVHSRRLTLEVTLEDKNA
ncbi:PAAR domain-containing protein [Paraburkholderia bannensis]|uniref:PAAR domain-containing protein n=1 Tax=Paraburkholderia bannensis TaxID=765414 RepID=UPI002ABD8D62|nr:PAAR domain-containing protein [Paraburkholderia bannensis]